MTRRRCLPIIVLTLALASLVLSACAAPEPTVPPEPTDTVVYEVPTAPASPTAPEVPTEAMPPTTVREVTPPPPEERGPLPRTQLTIMHTNDSRGFLDPCG